MTPVIDLPRAAALAAGLKTALSSATDAQALRLALLAQLAQACANANGQPGALRLVPRSAQLAAALSARTGLLEVRLWVTFTGKVGGPRIAAHAELSGLSLLQQALEALGGRFSMLEVHERRVLLALAVPLTRAPRLARLLSRRARMLQTQLEQRSRRRARVETLWETQPELQALKARAAQADLALAQLQAERARLHQEMASRSEALLAQAETAAERKLDGEIQGLATLLGAER